MKNNFWLYIILALPILTIPPYFFPADWGKSIAYRSILSVLLFLFVCQVFYKKDTALPVNIKNNKLAWSLTTYFAVFLAASIFSVDPNFSFWGSPYRGGGFVTLAFYFVFAMLAFILLKQRDWNKAWIFSIFIGILVSLVAITQYYGLFNLAVQSQPPSTMGNPILLAIYLLLLFFPTLSFAICEPFDTTQGKIKKIFYICSLAIFLFTILISGTRAAYLGIVVGVLYFLLFYPKKQLVLKKIIATFLICIAAVVIYANVFPNSPQILQKNRIFQTLESQLSIKNALSNERFLAWQIIYKEILDKPILGWGPENFSVGFDKNYDPNLTWSPWWDKAHNIFLDIGSQAGILGILSYLALFVTLFWQLQKHKNGENSVTIIAIQAGLIGYLISNFFSFDSFSTYLMFFLLVGYSLYLTSAEKENPHKSAIIRANPWLSSIIISILFIALTIFIYQYNLLPLQINAQINKASELANGKQCDQAFSLMDKILPKHSFLDSYARMEYVEFTKICNEFYPENNLTYIKNGLNLIKEAVKIQPLYTRYWIYLGNSSVALANSQTNPADKKTLLEQAGNYFDKAEQLAPMHQELPLSRARLKMVASDYKSAQSYAEKCVAMNPNLGDCYFYLALSELYQKNITDAKKNIQTADEKKYDMNSTENLNQLSDAYLYLSDWQDLVPVYQKLIGINTNVAQYHSTLAFLYKELGEYKKARQEAMEVLQLSPESKPSVDEFLKTLP